MEDREDLAEGLRDVLERYPRFRQAMLEADVWWEVSHAAGWGGRPTGATEPRTGG